MLSDTSTYLVSSFFIPLDFFSAGSSFLISELSDFLRLQLGTSSQVSCKQRATWENHFF